MPGPKAEDLSGQVFGNLKAISREGVDHNHHSIWKCECDCGNIINSTAQKLKKGRQTSCGCKHIQYVKEGDRFSRLIAIKKVRSSKWLCLCDCGKERIVASGLLMTGRIKSCGCMRGWAIQNKGEDLSGKQIGELTIECTEGKDKHGHTIWKAVCSCGKIVKVKASALGKNGTKSCGCKRLANRKNHKNWVGHEEIHGYIWGQITRGGHCRDLDFDITIEYAWDLFIKQDRKCAFTGLELSFPKTLSRENVSTRTASLDRIDSSKGYVKGNVQWIHKKIQPMKMNMPDEEFIQFCKLVANYRDEK